MIEGLPAWFDSASKRRRYLVGVSGGADSVALLYLLHRRGFKELVVCHLDHRLRGRASTEDARFVERLAARLGYPFAGGREKVAERAEAEKSSIETAGRQARHAFFARCAKEWRCPRLWLAHHADDQAETVLWNLLRGSHGARGIEAEQSISMEGRSMTVLRPLLGVRRVALRDWLESEGLKWREDATNADPMAVRNRLRLEAFPLLAEITRRDPVPSFEKAVRADAERTEIEAWAVAEAKVIDPQGRLHLPRLRELPEALQRACVADFLKNHGQSELSRALIDRALKLVDPEQPAALTLPGGRRLRRRAGRLWLED